MYIYAFKRRPFDDDLSAETSRKEEKHTKRQNVQRTKAVISKVRL